MVIKIFLKSDYKMPTYVKACKGRQIRRIDRLPVNAKAVGVAAGVSANAAQYWRPRPADDDPNSTGIWCES